MNIEQKRKAVNTFYSLDNLMTAPLARLFLDILKNCEDPNIIEQLCDNTKLLKAMQNDNEQIYRYFKNQRNLDPAVASKIGVNLLLMKQFNTENFNVLVRSKGFKEIVNGSLNINLLKDLNFADTIDEDYFYNMFDQIETNANDWLTDTEDFSGYDNNQIREIVELDPSRQQEIMTYIQTAQNPALMAKVIKYVAVAVKNIERTIETRAQEGLYARPSDITDKKNRLINLIKYTGSEPEIAYFSITMTNSLEEASLLADSMLKANFSTEQSKLNFMEILSRNKSRFNGQNAIAAAEFYSKFDSPFILEKLIDYNMTYLFKDITENNINYLHNILKKEKPTLLEETVMRLAKDIQEFKNESTVSEIEASITELVKNEHEIYLEQYKQISESAQREIEELKTKRLEAETNKDWDLYAKLGREIDAKNFIKAHNISKLLNDFRWKIGNYKGLAEIRVKSPETYQRIANSGILGMIESGKLNPNVIAKLNTNSDLSTEIYSDLETVRAGESIVPEFPAATSLEEAFSKTQVGDAVEIGSKMYINDGSQLSEWAMTKEKFLELFPPVERFASVQGRLGDCYLVSAISACMRNPLARAELYKSFRMEGNDIIVTIKGYEDYKGSTTFENGEIQLDNFAAHIIGCKGIQMLEQAYAKCALREPELDYLPVLDESLNTYSLMQRIQSGKSSTAMSELLGLENKGKNLGRTLSKATAYIMYSENKHLNIIKNVLNNKTAILHFGTRSKPQSAQESTFLQEYNLVSTHAYEIIAYDEETGLVTINNPHSASTVTKIPLEELSKYIQTLHITSID